MWEMLVLPSASVPALINIGKAFLSDFFMGSKFFCGNEVKKTGGDGQGVLLPTYFSVEVNF